MTVLDGCLGLECVLSGGGGSGKEGTCVEDGVNRWCGQDDLVVVVKLERSEMASPSKRRRADDDNGAEDESGLLKLIHRRRGDVEMLMEHIEHLENEVCTVNPQLLQPLECFLCRRQMPF